MGQSFLLDLAGLLCGWMPVLLFCFLCMNEDRERSLIHLCCLAHRNIQEVGDSVPAQGRLKTQMHLFIG
jgi:hypothetical protein